VLNIRFTCRDADTLHYAMAWLVL